VITTKIHQSNSKTDDQNTLFMSFVFKTYIIKLNQYRKVFDEYSKQKYFEYRSKNYIQYIFRSKYKKIYQDVV